jgi:rhodanese-related sulfurtransferase
VSPDEQADLNLDPARVRELHESGAAQLIDVRRPEEVEAGHIAGSVHIEMTEVGARADELDRDRPVIFYCRVGSRSAFVTEAFRNAGFEAHNMAGGLQAWTEQGLPLEPQDGSVAPD